MNLAGNPLCDLLGYPFVIFSYLPGIQMLNGIEKVNYVSPPPNKSFEQHRNFMQKRTLPLSLDTIEHVLSPENEAESRLDYAMLQLNSLNKAFDSQEKFLAERLCDPTSSMDPSFPYTELLSNWRNHVLKLLTEKQMLLRDLRKKDFEHQLEVGRLTKQLSEKDKNLKTWQDRFTAANLKMQSLESKIVALEQEKIELSLHMKDSTTSSPQEMEAPSDQFHYMRDMVVECRKQIESQTFGTQVNLLRAVEKLRGMETRVRSAVERIQFLGALNAQNEIKLRNSAAALEAEKILWRHTNNVGISSSGHLDTHNEETQTEGRKLVKNASDENKVFEIRPEVETLLRLLFRRLDSEDTGLCSVASLYQSLTIEHSDENDVDVDHRDGEIQQMLKSGLGTAGFKRLIHNLTALGGDLFRINGTDMHDSNSKNNEINDDHGNAVVHNVDADGENGDNYCAHVTDTSRCITWGEFLLLLLPHARISYFSEYGGRLSNDEYVNIHKKEHLLGDDSWGMVPLNMKEDRYL